MTKRLLPALVVLAITAPRLEAQQVDPSWMHADSAARRVTFDLIAGVPGVNGGLNFNGFTTGGLTFVAPVGWQVTFSFVNRDPALTHSFEVITPRDPLPIQAVTPSIPGAGSKELLLGVAAGRPAELVKFTAAPAGDYLVYCAVPGHGMAGMWVRLKIDAAARRPTVIPTPAAAH
ncbi:MAG TPA: sulfocyanin-like copper-binding protein [Gemmatimonadales bacterium]|nr:sulfocyanin-like copper-binding protein [Gemmatimonadales bacterium]